MAPTKKDADKAIAAVAGISNGKMVNEDGWMSMWCNSAWGDLLAPAPLSMSVLGSMIVIASSTTDFSLIAKTPEGAPPFKWQYAKFPGSFKACLQQMVNEGYLAFDTVHKGMLGIQAQVGHIPGVITQIVQILFSGDHNDIEELFPDKVENLIEYSKAAQKYAVECADAFHGVRGLAMEMVLACTTKEGTSAQALAAGEIHLEVLKSQETEERERLKTAKDTHDTFKKAFVQSQEDFHEAVDAIPGAGTIFGLNVGDAVTGLLVNAGNAAISQATLRSQVTTMVLAKTLGADDKKTPGTGQPSTGGTPAAPAAPSVSQPSPETVSDPATLYASQVVGLIKNIQTLLGDGKPVWADISSTSTDPKKKTKTGGEFTKFRLEKVKERMTEPTKPLSAQLLPIIDKAIKIMTTMLQVASSAQQNDDAFDKTERPATDALLEQAQALATAANLVLQQTGLPAKTFEPPPLQSSGAGAMSSAKTAVETAKYKVDQTRSQLEASRASYEKSSDALLKSQADITKLIGEVVTMTGTKLANASLREILPVLQRAVGAFATLRDQFSRLVRFFDSIAVLLVDVMAPSVDSWVKDIKVGQNRIVGGVSLSQTIVSLIYQGMMVPIKVSKLAGKVSDVYLKVADKHITPAQAMIGELVAFAGQGDKGDNDSFLATLQEKQDKLGEVAKKASQDITDLVAKEQKTFAKSIDDRLANIVHLTKDVFPSVTGPPPKALTAVTDAHVEEVAKGKAEELKNNAMYADPSGMT